MLGGDWLDWLTNCYSWSMIWEQRNSVWCWSSCLRPSIWGSPSYSAICANYSSSYMLSCYLIVSTVSIWVYLGELPIMRYLFFSVRSFCTVNGTESLLNPLIWLCSIPSLSLINDFLSWCVMVFDSLSAIDINLVSIFSVLFWKDIALIYSYFEIKISGVSGTFLRLWSKVDVIHSK